MDPGRVFAVFRRHAFALRHSPPGVFDLFLWPLLDLLMWGLLSSFIREHPGAIPIPVGYLLGGVLLWDLLFRSNLGISVSFLDDTSWTHNVLNLLVSPLRPSEWLAGAALFSLAKLAVGWGIMAVLASLLFAFTVVKIGLVLVALAFALVVFGVALAMLVIGLVLRFGHGADILAWGMAAMLAPLGAVYYPVDVLPEWARTIAIAMPPAHVFESMRTVLSGAPVPWGSLGAAFVLDGVYLALAFWFAVSMLATFRRKGLVTRYM